MNYITIPYTCQRLHIDLTPANIGAAEATHTHNYAGSSSAGGAADSATRLIMHESYPGIGLPGWALLCEITLTSPYADQYIIFDVLQRGGRQGQIYLKYYNRNTKDPDVEVFSKTGSIICTIAKYDTSKWGLFVEKAEMYDWIDIRVSLGEYMLDKINIEWKDELTTPPTDPACIEGLHHTDTINTTGNAATANSIIGSGVVIVDTTVTDTTTSDKKRIQKTGLFTDNHLIWALIQSNKYGVNSYIIPMAYLKSKGSLQLASGGISQSTYSDSIWFHYIDDNTMSWFEKQDSGAASYTTIRLIKIL